MGGDLEVRLLDGGAMGTKAELMAEFARGLDLPGWFGSNWDALDDCLTDLSWLPGPDVVILIDRTERVLADDPSGDDGLRVLRRVVTGAGRALIAPDHPRFDGEVESLHVVAFHDPAHLAVSRVRLGDLLDGEAATF